jgi:glycosyltransferase involved in cell wall biosynthesis
MMRLSVVICSYNPKASYLRKCLDSILIASKKFEPIELIIIDNNSSDPIQNTINEWGMENYFQVVVETKQGLTNARLKGITVSSGSWILYVDDDNVIAPDFFYMLNNITVKYPFIGCMSGQAHLEMEVEPSPNLIPYLGLLVSRELERDCWSNSYFLHESMPSGAGLAVRRNVAEYYFKLHENGKRPLNLDRTGSSLLSGGDNDLSLCAIDMGMGIGVFKDLHLQHLIPASRLNLKYLLQLNYWIEASAVVLRKYRKFPEASNGLGAKIKNLYHLSVKNQTARLFHWSTITGNAKGRKIVEEYQL